MRKRIAALISALAITAMVVPSYQVKAETATKAETKAEEKMEEKKNESDANSSDAGEKMDIPSGEAVDENEAKEVIGKMNEAMAKVKNFDYSAQINSEAMGNKINMSMEGIVDLENGISHFVTDIMGSSMETAFKDGKAYSQNPMNPEEWIYVEMPDMDLKGSYMIEETGLEFLAVEKLAEGGYVIKTKEPLDLEGLKKISKADSSNPMEQMGTIKEMTTTMAYVIDEDFRIIKQYQDSDMKMDMEGTEMDVKSAAVGELSNFDNAEKIELPKEIEEAKPASDSSSVPAKQ